MTNTDYLALNAMLNLYSADGKIQFDKDKEAARQYFLEHVNPNTVFFHSTEEKLRYLVDKGYYDKAVLDQYTPEDITEVFAFAYGFKFRFPTFVGAYKFYTQYALKTNDGERYLERFEDRVTMVALGLAQGDRQQAMNYITIMIAGVFQPATPTFLNVGRAKRGELVSCFLLETSDSMTSIAAVQSAALQLSKRGGGVGINLTNLRGLGDKIKGVENAAAGVVPVMKILEDSFKYANQLGQRQGAGAVYLNVHHPDIMEFLDTKRENADEAVRIKTLSLGVVIPDITFELAKKNEDMYTFSPHDVEKAYGVPFSDINVTEKYYEMLDNPDINKKKVSARQVFQTIAELQFESGYPYVMFEDNVNRDHHNPGKVKFSNLCSEIMQVSTPTEYDERDGSIITEGRDISCNLGSLNIAKAMDNAPSLGSIVGHAVRALTSVSDQSDIAIVSSVRNGNERSHSIGLGYMNLHGFLAREGIHYGSPESLEFIEAFASAVRYHALWTSNKLAFERGETFEGFWESAYATGEALKKYIDKDYYPANQKAAELVEKFSLFIPSPDDWRTLSEGIQRCGLYNAYLFATPPTGSISYVNGSTASVHPITAQVEIRKEGKMGRVYYPAPYLTNENREYYTDAYEIGPEKIIDTYAAFQEHIDQGMSLTLFFKDTATTRDINKAQIYAWKKGIKSLYYIRLRQDALEGTEVEGCVSCTL